MQLGLAIDLDSLFDIHVAIIISGLMLAFTLGIAVTNAIWHRSPVDRLLRRGHFGV